MANRQQLQSELETLLGSKNVYYQSPSSGNMGYPAIRYEKADIDTRYANNKKYINKTLYNITVIDRVPDNPVIEKILELPFSSYDRPYTSNNLNHDVIKLYY